MSRDCLNYYERNWTHKGVSDLLTVSKDCLSTNAFLRNDHWWGRKYSMSHIEYTPNLAICWPFRRIVGRNIWGSNCPLWLGVRVNPNPKSQGADEKEFDEKNLLVVSSRRGDRLIAPVLHDALLCCLIVTPLSVPWSLNPFSLLGVFY